MIHVQKRLELTDVGDLTQGIEKDIIDTLKEMIDALKKARDDNQNDPSKPGRAGKRASRAIRSCSNCSRNSRWCGRCKSESMTGPTDYGKRFPGEEQARDPQIVRELAQSCPSVNSGFKKSSAESRREITSEAHSSSSRLPSSVRGQARRKP